MYILQNALRNIARNKGRNVLIGVIIFAIILTAVVALIINNTAAGIIAREKEKYVSEVKIDPGFSYVEMNGRQMGRMNTISAELLLAFTQAEHLKESVATASISASSNDIRAIDQNDDEDDSGGSAPGQYTASPDRGGSVSFSSVRIGSLGNYRLLGDDWKDFEDNKRRLSEGEMPQNNGECLVSEDLAELNGIKVGDVITFTARMNVFYDLEEYGELESGETITINGVEYAVQFGGNATREVTYELTVTGIYLDLTDEYQMAGLNVAFLNKRNEVLTTLWTLLEEMGAGEHGVNVNVNYYLKNPDLLSAFEQDVRAMGLSDDATVYTDAEGYKNAVKSIEGLQGVSITFMVIVLVLGGIILLLISLISIRERKYEIGVLRAIGMKKSRVAVGLWAEVFAVTFACLLIGVAAGSAVAQPVSDILLKNQIESDQNSNQMGPGMQMGRGQVITGGARISPGGGGGPMFFQSIGGGGNIIDEMPISLGLDTIAQISLIALLLSSLAALVSISMITKYEPIKILMERN